MAHIRAARLARLVERSARRRRRMFKFRQRAEPALLALRTLRSRAEQAALDELNAPQGTPPLGLDLAAPRWAMLFTGFPGDLNDEERSCCEMIMGMAPLGAPPPDWTAILLRVIELFELSAQRAGSDATMRLIPLSNDQDDSFCQGRGFIFMPGFSYARARGWWVPSDQLVDPRRARRRSHRSVPEAWRARFKDQAQTLWSLGLSVPRLDAELRGFVKTWSLTAHCVAQALKEHGCVWTGRVPGFFSRYPAALDDLNLMSTIDRDALDPLRALWALEASTHEPTSCERVRKLTL